MSRFSYNSTTGETTVTSGLPAIDSSLSTTSTNPVQNKVINSALGALNTEVTSLNEALSNKVLYLTSVACAATTGNFASVSNAAITADHVLAECVFANPAVIISDVTWTSAAGSLTLNGTCASATTANIVLVKKDN